MTLSAASLLEGMAIIIFTGAAMSMLSKVLRLPDVVLYILAGVLLGTSGLHWIQLDHAVVNQVILTFGASYILFDGGREIRLIVLNRIKLSVALLSTVGVLVSACIVAAFTRVFLHLDLITGLLLGAVISSTDPSVLIPLFKKINISAKLKQTIIAESACNDACSAILAVAVLSIITGGNFSLGHSIFMLLKEALGGIAVGVAVGFVIMHLISDRRHGLLSEFPSEIIVASVIASYQIATQLEFSGFMAVFVFGILVGNIDAFKVSLPAEYAEMHLNFKDALISMLRMMIFILLGAHMRLDILYEYGLSALVVVLMLMFVARPISVLCSLLPDRQASWSWREIVYLMWTRETGVIPAALAGVMVTQGIPHAELISAVTFMAILLTLILQASSAGWAARTLKLEEPLNE